MNIKRILLLIGTILLAVFVLYFGIHGLQQLNSLEKESEETKTDNGKIINKNSTVDDIIIDNEKINIYLFWGDGCPHCEELMMFFRSIDNEYGKYYRLYAFEVWYNNDNGMLMDGFGSELGDKTKNRNVPYFIIGEESFAGYNSNMNNDIIDTILSQYEKRSEINKFENVVGK